MKTNATCKWNSVSERQEEKKRTTSTDGEVGSTAETNEGSNAECNLDGGSRRVDRLARAVRTEGDVVRCTRRV